MLKEGFILIVKAVMRSGYVGTGNYNEKTRYLVVNSIVDAMNVAKAMPRVKKNSFALASCKLISETEYLEGKHHETQDPSLNTYNHKGQKAAYRIAQRIHANSA